MQHVFACTPIVSLAVIFIHGVHLYSTVDDMIRIACTLIWYSVVESLLLLKSRRDANFMFTRQQMHDVAKLTSDDVMYGLSRSF